MQFGEPHGLAIAARAVEEVAVLAMARGVLHAGEQVQDVGEAQPVVDLLTNKISGFEALIRWHHPQRGIISPAEFIPVAVETGLIVPLGEWVIRQSCADAVCPISRIAARKIPFPTKSRFFIELPPTVGGLPLHQPIQSAPAR